MAEKQTTPAAAPPDAAVQRWRPEEQAARSAEKAPVEIGGRKDGSEPTRFGDWERQGRCIDF